MNISLQQTELWQNLQTDLGETSFFEKNQDFQYLAIKKSTPFGPYLYLPYGPFAQTATGFQKALKNLKNLAKSQNAIFVRIEPQNRDFLPKIPKNARKTHEINPENTWVLDLTPEKSVIISNFDQGTRTRFNTFAKKGLSVSVSKNPDDIKYLVDLQQKLAKTKKIGAFSANYLKTELKQDFATLYLVHYADAATNSDKIIAASLFFDFKDTRFYMQSAADAEFKKLPGTVALLTTAIFDAKAKNLKNFDFWGIAPENAKNHPWAGFTAFKKSFGGSAVHYCGTFDIVENPLKYTFYTVFRAANRFFRKIRA